MKLRLGCHVGPGASHATETVAVASAAGMTALQVFSGGRINRRVILPPDPSACAEAMQDVYGMVHAAYVINLCVPPSSELAKLSVKCLRQTLSWADACGFASVVVHPGSAKEEVPEKARGWCAENTRRVLGKHKGEAELLLENAAGDARGRIVGQNLEELEGVLAEVADPRLGLCVDTVHAWAAGYSLAEIKKLGKKHPAIAAWHLNNPRVEVAQGSHKDRHGTWNEGLWDDATFLSLMKALRSRPMVMETRTASEDFALARRLTTNKKS